MDVSSIEAWARGRMADADDSPMERGYRLHHGERVGALAVALARRLDLGGTPPELYRVAGLVHDVGKAGYRGPEPHGPRGERILREEAAQWFEPGELDLVCLMVRNHYERPLSRWYDGREKPVWPLPVLILQDADLIDHFGVNYLWITINHGRRDGLTPAGLYAVKDEPGTRRGEGWVRDCLRSLNFDVSREEVLRRQKLAEAFYTEAALGPEGGLGQE